MNPSRAAFFQISRGNSCFASSSRAVSLSNSPRANWYKMTAGHNTVVVDGQDQQEAEGRTTLWAEGESFKAIRFS